MGSLQGLIIAPNEIHCLEKNRKKKRLKDIGFKKDNTDIEEIISEEIRNMRYDIIGSKYINISFSIND